MATSDRPLVSKVSISVRRPNEYTTWKPRIDRHVSGSTLVWGVLVIGVER